MQNISYQQYYTVHFSNDNLPALQTARKIEAASLKTADQAEIAFKTRLLPFLDAKIAWVKLVDLHGQYNIAGVDEDGQTIRHTPHGERLVAEFGNNANDALEAMRYIECTRNAALGELIHSVPPKDEMANSPQLKNHYSFLAVKLKPQVPLHPVSKLKIH